MAPVNEARPITYTAVCERVGRWWEITVPELDEITQARTLDEVPETVADLVATMTGADPTTVQVRVEAEAGPGLTPVESPDTALESWTVEAVSLPDGSVVLYHAPPGLTEVERRTRERKAREFAARMYEQDERNEQDQAG
jgi:hypothetical protein